MRILASAAMSVLVLLIPTEGWAQSNRRGPLPDAINNLLDPITWAPIRDFDVVGVKLGMSPEQARLALKAKNFTPQAVDPLQPSWAALVSSKVAERGGSNANKTTIANFTMAKGGQGEHIEVWYAPTKDGARVVSVKYQIPANRMASASFLNGLVTRYGRASFVSGNKRIYCERGKDSRQSCVGIGDVADRPALIAKADYSLHTINLVEGKAMAESRKSQLALEVEETAPKNAAVSF